MKNAQRMKLASTVNVPTHAGVVQMLYVMFQIIRQHASVFPVIVEIRYWDVKVVNYHNCFDKNYVVLSFKILSETRMNLLIY